MEALIFFYHKEVLLVNVEAGCITHWLSYTTEKAGIAAPGVGSGGYGLKADYGSALITSLFKATTE